ncbi:putative Aldehyde reductase 2 [Glarea lozoyensis 74030]|uniref:Putative Aldehyde reductase 2 n=1 Tax=Glarea lozoyensis (strain ATCC 74030 / MF5533) TaxID=1104152 RepID=H0ERX1_GLAL7|nr:putative Aldehyde reductase 2 [Glarea lozoyensis 74030]
MYITVPKGSTIIVTGANGYLGMHVADQLLASGYKVKGTVRDADKVQWTTEYFNEKYGKGSYEALSLPGSTGVIHVASDVTFGPDPNEVIPGVIDGITSLLNSAALEPSIKSFVLTSSSAAIDQGRLGQKYLVDGNLWNHEAVKAAWAPPPYTAERAIMVYFASKTQAEQKAWELVKSGECSDLRFNAVNPNFMMGRFLHPKQNKSSGGMVMGVRNNDSRAVDTFKSFGWQWMVDVVDVAKLHVIALVDPAVRRGILASDCPFKFRVKHDA